MKQEGSKVRRDTIEPEDKSYQTPGRRRMARL